AMRLVVAAGQPAPGGGAFDRFDVAAQPVAAPINGNGRIAFYASVVRANAREGIFLSTGSRIVKVAALGDAVPGGGTLSEFAKHPLPALNDAGKVAFGAAIAGARASEGLFLAADGSLKAIALSGTDAPGIISGTFAEFDLPALNNLDDVVFLASVRRGREVVPVLYLWSQGKLRKLVAAGDLAPGGGTFTQFGVPAINNNGVVAFPAIVEHGTVLGGLFLAGTVSLRLLVGAGETGPGGAMLTRFSERISLSDSDNVAFGAHLGTGTRAEGMFLANPVAGIEQVAVVGDAAPSGGRFAGFGPWPTIGANGTVAFMAALDDGPAPLALYATSESGLSRIAATGDRLPDGRVLATFALNPVAMTGPNGGVTFATMGDGDAAPSGIYYFGPPPKGE
ncbi:MAG: hypothetical protein QOF41_710, partial [Methylobacteriaceae bacterium]|nr:hypothetical protein [Methylobacteriaceae bacterium]